MAVKNEVPMKRAQRGSQFRPLQQAALANMVARHCLPTDIQTVDILDRLLAEAAERPAAEASGRIALPALDIVLITAARYAALPRSRWLRSAPSFAAPEERLAAITDLLRELRDTLGRYASLALNGVPPVPVEELTNRLFALLEGTAADLEPRQAGVRLWRAGFIGPRPIPLYDAAASAAACELARVFVPQTKCIFATGGKYWGAPTWQETRDLGENTAVLAAALDRFLKIGRVERMDGFLLKCGPQMSLSVDRLAYSMARLLQGLNAVDPWRSSCLVEDIENPAWKFSFAGESMFVNAFGVCYPPDHPRHTFGNAATYFFFQPDYTLRSHPLLAGEKEFETRAKILAVFESVGITYANHNKQFEAARYIRPLQPDAGPVRWWDHLVTPVVKQAEAARPQVEAAR